MCGPSSSHSAGCARIGLETRLLFGREINKANIIFDESGSYPETYIGQGSNFGFTGGLLGFKTDNAQVKDAVEIAKSLGKEIWFSKQKLSSRHPNEALINVYNEKNEIELSVLTFSTGGGMFEIVELNGLPVFIDGAKEQIFICSASGHATQITEMLDQLDVIVNTSSKDGRMLHAVSAFDEKTKEKLLALNKQPNVLWVKYAPVIMPVAIQPNPIALFTNAEGALAYAKATGKPMWEIALDYEISISKVTQEEIWQLAEQTYDIMKLSTIPPDPEKTPMYGFLPYKAQEMKQAIKSTNAIPSGVLNEAALAAISVMENSCAHNIVVAAPTAGSSGVIPAAIITIGESLNLPKKDIMKGLLVSGLIGSFISNNASFGAEVAACQAENGSASAMAAGGIVQLLGGNIEQAFQAASMALQNMLGLICDPVGGLTEIPCISRNVSSVSNAALSANMVMWGFNPVIPLDETIHSMYDVGQKLPAAFRCTCQGGLCTTKTGNYLAQSLLIKREKL
ncbi:L-serine ammonia-lyase, iron-sulfur-dependent, subunit alpha [Zophobihabitans entericus]|uniref:L-serine ammonia-lyase n=1 Tax=Zophobihabitans entericus TaxID=1635327 RepID=A0A6G9I9C0_9GAMM|nr:L-serine ammonia-lyase, iron-sulfur-dependent, subunit alpha [Zophobihabitans entericus]QIQ20429.1 hypothetical protein IPMB12_01275 [Zophobihabitans entericus]